MLKFILHVRGHINVSAYIRRTLANAMVTHLIPITVIKFPAQSYVCVQNTSEIDEDIVITDIQNCRYYIATLRQSCVVIWTHTSSEGQGYRIPLLGYKFLNYPDKSTKCVVRQFCMAVVGYIVLQTCALY
ncbi:hypothetical protein D5R81_09470 [Parashewanella spongiae]|uniref:Uncharacterized protein n=1 Tax=Parashewanella spongiae TaxID=342950 RepID=A0A3A6TQE3_9GAMM|nr:hypothetical protein D5R81_09470 [Parashewanella spongiae]